MNKDEVKNMILRVLKEYQFGDNLKDGSYITGVKKYEFGNVAEEIVKNLNIPIVGVSVCNTESHAMMKVGVLIKCPDCDEKFKETER